MEIINYFKKLFYIIDEKKTSMLIIFLSLLLSFLDLLVLSLIGGYVSFVLSYATNSVSSILIEVEILNNLFQFIKNLNINKQLLYFSLIILVLLFLRMALSIFVNLIVNIYSLNEEINMKKKIFKYLYNQDYKKYLNISENEFNSSIIYYPREYRAQSLILILKVFSEIIVISVLFFFLLFKFPFASLVLLLISFVFVIFYDFTFRKKLKKIGEDLAFVFSNELKLASDFFKGFKSLKLLNANEVFFKNYFNTLTKYKKSAVFKEMVAMLPRLLIEYCFYLLIIFIVITSVIFESKFNMVSSLSIFIYAAIRLIPSVTLISNSIVKIRTSIHLVDYLYKILKTINTDYLEKENKVNIKIENFESLELKNMNFSYTKNKNIISDLNFKIKKDKIIGISGESGSGKTTLVDIIVGFLKPSSGEIILNEKKVDFEIETYQDLFFYLPQNRIIFDFDLETNITLTTDKEKIDYKFLNNLMKDCYLDDFILDEKNNEYKELRHNANNISGGQQQRIILARAIYSKKKILILDESTNALDKELQLKIIRNIKKYFKNIIIISHDIDSIDSLIDELYIFKNAKILRV